MSSGLRGLLNLTLCVVVAWASSKCADAQSTWQTFSPPDQSFTVELPGKPQVVKAPPQENESSVSLFDNIKSGYAYTFSLKKNDAVPDFSFGVAHLSQPISNNQFDESANSHILWIGGDDKHFSKEADVAVSGFHGREFIYDKGRAVGRALFINAGYRIYYMMFHTEVEGDNSSEAVRRIFRTFKPARRGVRRTKYPS